MSDRRFAEVPIYKGSDLAKLAELDQAAKAAMRRAEQPIQDSRFGDVPLSVVAQEAKDAYDAFVREAAERAEIVRVEALGRRQWRDLLDEHAPRRVTRLISGSQTEVVHEDDEDLGVNLKTFPDALLTFVDPLRPDMRTIVAPEFPTAAARLEWLDELSGGDFDRLFLTAFNLNGSLGGDPKETTYGSTPTSSTTSG